MTGSLRIFLATAEEKPNFLQENSLLNVPSLGAFFQIGLGHVSLSKARQMRNCFDLRGFGRTI
jgi:hypothetical protein